MRKFTMLLFLVLAMTTLASAQFTMTFGTNISSDDENIYESVSMIYSPNYGCTMCVTAGHTYSGSMMMQSDQGPSSECDYGTSAAGNQYQSLGCETGLTLDWNADDNVQGFVSAKNICSMIGTFLYVGMQSTQLITELKSAYKEALPCTELSSVSWVCSVTTFGFGCPGKCTALQTTKVVTPGAPQGYEQCVDVVVAGVCNGQICKSQGSPGLCTGLNN
jgi:hypothetical protein